MQTRKILEEGIAEEVVLNARIAHVQTAEEGMVMMISEVDEKEVHKNKLIEAVLIIKSTLMVFHAILMKLMLNSTFRSVVPSLTYLLKAGLHLSSLRGQKTQSMQLRICTTLNLMVQD